LIKRKQNKYYQLESRAIITEKRVKLLLEEYEDFKVEVIRRQWEKLVTTCPYFHEATIREFYANVCPVSFDEITKTSWVMQVSYDATNIIRYLHINLDLEGEIRKKLNRRRKDVSLTIPTNQLRILGSIMVKGTTGLPKKLYRASMSTLTQLWASIMFANIFPILMYLT